MSFAAAVFALKRGHKVKRKHWTGYWQLVDNEVIMFTYDNNVINLRDSTDIMYTLENCACDDWEIVDDWHATKELEDK